MSQILVPVDGSAPSHNALTHACEQYPDAEITAVNIVHPDMVYTSAGAGMKNDEQAEVHADPILEDAEEVATEYDVNVMTEWRVGSPVKEIISYADEIDAECIVMGTHGRQGMERVILGSVAEQVARHADVRVTIVPAPE